MATKNGSGKRCLTLLFLVFAALTSQLGWAASGLQIPPVAGDPAQSAVRNPPDSILTRDAAEFKRLYALVLASKSMEDRIRAGEAVRAACLSWDETGWLMYCLLVPGETTLAQIEKILGEDTGGMFIHGLADSPIINTWYSFDIDVTAHEDPKLVEKVRKELGLPEADSESDAVRAALELRGKASDEQRHSMLLATSFFLKLSRSVDATELRTPQKARWDEKIRSGETATAVDADAGDVILPFGLQRHLDLFCGIYERALSASGVSEANQLAREVHGSMLSDDEKAWLIYCILDYGLNGAEADRISGPFAAWYDDSRSLTNPLERHYELGIKVTLSRPGGPVAKIALTLYKPHIE
jgi:hypothetical protein